MTDLGPLRREAARSREGSQKPVRQVNPAGVLARRTLRLLPQPEDWRRPEVRGLRAHPTAGRSVPSSTRGHTPHPNLEGARERQSSFYWSGCDAIAGFCRTAFCGRRSRTRDTCQVGRNPGDGVWEPI